MKQNIRLIFSGSLLLLALMGVIVASAAYSTPWGLFVLIPYVLVPMTAAIFYSLAGSDDHSVWTSFGCFFEALLWIATLAIPSILHRVDAINGSQLGWLLVSDVLVFASFMSMVFTGAD
ncbi:unnamed protein product [Peronospora belbahrii]|uniref:Vacuolar protein sorting 55 n=1 Tax=Peronospora belbahrii TaxID=622444 RepID=A0AAU9KZ61_9STRA|nr:unnamed protein product [Peronospora belbahrii]CAH0521030.1 unnamed protein product [Peronospora belbahrii]